MDSSGSSEIASCKGREDGDGPTGSERPLKKARFAWQVKGRYHLKNDISEAKAATSSSAAVETSESRSTSTDVNVTEQNLEILGDYLLKQDFNTLDSVIAEPEKSLLTPSTIISNANVSYPRYVSSTNNNVDISLNKSSNSSNVQSQAMIAVQNSISEDHCIAKWQARQMAKGFVDNTINHVLDSWIHVPLPAEAHNTRFLALDVAEFINNMPEDNSIENEGILMAISAHGLQKNSSSSSNSDTSESGSSPCGNASPARSSTPSPSEDEKDCKLTEQVHLIQHNASCVKSANKFELPWSISDDEKNECTSSLSESPVETYECLNENENSNIEQHSDENMDGNYYDILDAAILFAIHNKGLTFGTDYG